MRIEKENGLKDYLNCLTLKLSDDDNDDSMFPSFIKLWKLNRVKILSIKADDSGVIT